MRLRRLSQGIALIDLDLHLAGEHLLEELKEKADSTLIFYASPHNLVKFLEEIRTVFGEIPVALMRELTKKFEEHLIGTPSEHLEHYKERVPKGEYVLIFHPQGKGGL